MFSRISAGVDLVFLIFITMIPIDCKIIIFPYTCNNYKTGELTRTTSKERMTTNIIFAGATLIN